MALMNKQFIRNIPSLTKNEQEQLADRHVLVAGCGGLGGYAIEYLTRLGIGKLTVADNDEFETTNLNRQLLATHDTLGKFKVFAAEARAKAINPNIAICPWHSRIDKNTADTAIHGTDLVIDALDNAGGSPDSGRSLCARRDSSDTWGSGRLACAGDGGIARERKPEKAVCKQCLLKKVNRR